MIIASIAVILVSFLRITNFRKPTGRYGVGKITYHLIDTSRQETSQGQTNDPRELMIYVHYPTDHTIQSPATQYDCDALNSAKAFVTLKTGIPALLMRGWNCIKTYTQGDVAISRQREQYPIIIVPHGGGTMIQHYTWMLEELASNGYIAVGINHPYMAALTRMPDGRLIKSLVLDPQNKDKKLLEVWKNEQIEVCVADIKFILTYLKELNGQAQSPLQGKLDLERIGCAGHSFGGHLALIVGMTNPAIKAVVDMDGGQRAFSFIVGKKYPIPCIIMLADKSRQWCSEQGQKDRTILEDFCLNNKQNVSEIVIKNVGHGVFSDLALLMNSTLFTRFISHVYDLDLDASSAVCCKALDEISSEMVQFFDTNLKTEPYV